MYQTIFQVMSDADCVLATASESKAYEKALTVPSPWICRMKLNTEPHEEYVYPSLREFRYEYNLH